MRGNENVKPIREELELLLKHVCLLDMYVENNVQHNVIGQLCVLKNDRRHAAVNHLLLQSCGSSILKWFTLFHTRFSK